MGNQIKEALIITKQRGIPNTIMMIQGDDKQ